MKPPTTLSPDAPRPRGHRFGLVLPGPALFVLGALLGLSRLLTGLPAFGLAMAGAGLSLVALLALGVALLRDPRRRTRSAAWLALLAAAPPAVVTAAWLSLGGAPPIHDVTTDLADPPPILSEAGPVPFPADTAAVHRAAYGDLAPLDLPLSPGDALTACAAVADRDLELLSADPSTGLVRAVDRSGVFGFIDDVTIRVRPRPDGGSRVDLRSRSRQGQSDFGVNARRLRALHHAIAPAPSDPTAP